MKAGLDDLGWLARNQYWAEALPEEKRRGAPARRTQKPLVLTGHGLGLRVDQGTLLVKDGFTHYPQTQTVHRFFPGDRNMPSRVILVDGNGNITLDALGWLTDQNVPLIRIDWRGNVTTVVGNSAAPDHRLVRAQLAAQESQKTTLRIATSLIAAKLKNSIDTLRDLPEAERAEKAITVHRASIDEIRLSPPKSIRALLGIEGRSAQAYFSAWKGLPLRWKGTGRKPIPADWTSFGARTSLQSTKAQNRNASHPVNAMLNYAYAVLESRVRSEIVAHGYDPMIGYLHAYAKDRAALVFDLMEPLRPIADRVVLKFAQSQTLARSDFSIRSDGVCRLNPQLAKHVVGLFDLNLSVAEMLKLPPTIAPVT